MHEQTHKIMEVAHLGGHVAMIINETVAYGLDGTVSAGRAASHTSGRCAVLSGDRAPTAGRSPA